VLPFRLEMGGSPPSYLLRRTKEKKRRGAKPTVWHESSSHLLKSGAGRRGHLLVLGCITFSLVSGEEGEERSWGWGKITGREREAVTPGHHGMKGEKRIFDHGFC